MEARKRTLVMYQTKDGREPLTQWILSLRDRVAAAQIAARIDRLILGAFGDCRSVGEGVSEMRIDYGPGYRIYFGEDGPIIVVLLCGGDKRLQPRDIRAAKYFWRDYKERKS